tara:strand:- start:274 stop:459 length:186 start_codon:yes stop_codon:yes gene_type:complete
MGKMKEVFALHQQELDDLKRHYSDMYELSKYMSTEHVFEELYKATVKIKTSNKLKKEKNVR